MNVRTPNNVIVKGKGSQALMFAHGFGCDQNVWRYVAPAFEENYNVILFNHVGAGNSDLSAFIPTIKSFPASCFLSKAGIILAKRNEKFVHDATTFSE